jgi:hypothetical protein
VFRRIAPPTPADRRNGEHPTPSVAGAGHARRLDCVGEYDLPGAAHPFSDRSTRALQVNIAPRAGAGRTAVARFDPIALWWERVGRPLGRYRSAQRFASSLLVSALCVSQRTQPEEGNTCQQEP